jgi:hypothetical protein
MDDQLEPVEERQSTKEILRLQRKKAYEETKRRRREERQQQRQSLRQAKSDQRKQRDDELWNALKRASELESSSDVSGDESN